jgi:hypothetical protein
MDLSKMLDELYHEEEDEDSEEPVDREPEGPEWAEDARLEEVFSSWTPGPPAEAAEAEREMASGLGNDADLRAELRDDDLDTLGSSDLEDVGPMGWSRSQDDVLAGARRSRLSLRRR